MNRHGALIVPMLLMVGTLAGTGARADERSVEQQVAADANGVVSIDNVAGSITVSGWDRHEVGVHAELGADALRLVVTSESGHTHVRVEGYTNYPDTLAHLLQKGGGEAQLQVQVPRGSDLSITGVSANIRSTGIAGPQHLQAVSGNIDAEVYAAPVDVRTLNGSIGLVGKGQASRISAASVTGDVHLGQGAGDVQATSVTGNLQLTINPAGAVHLRTTSGNIRIDGALASRATLEMNTVSGRIEVHTAAPDGLVYDVNSFSGDIGDCFGQSAEHVARYGPGSRLTGTRGDGMASVRIRTLSGEVSLCDRAPQRP